MLSQSEYLEVPFQGGNNHSNFSNSEKNSSSDMNPLYKSCGGSAKGSNDADDLQQQVLKYKEKAHQSFMQVMYNGFKTGKCSSYTKINSKSSVNSSKRS